MKHISSLTSIDIRSQWNWVGKLSLFTGLISLVILCGLLAYVGRTGEGEYLDLIRAHSLTRQQLGPALLLGGLLILALISLSTWLFALYTSFRFAGPIYRFQQNLEAAQHLQAQLGIRQDDALQDVSRELHESVKSLYAHYDELHALVDDALQVLHATPENSEKLNSILNQLKQVEARVTLDD